MSDFWSRRRKAVAEEEEKAAEETARTDAESEAAEIAALPEAEQLDRLGLPDPDNVRSGDDVAAFMAKAVPLALRNRALRSLWRSNPVLANLDGLNDYDTDFGGDGLRGGALRTSYEVGRGLTRHLQRMVAETDPEALSDETSRENPPQMPDTKTLDPEPPVVERLAGGVASEEDAASAVTSRDRPVRMRFTFEEDERE